MDKDTIGKKLKELRIEKGKSLRQAASEMGIGSTALANYESGFRIPRDGVKVTLADYYNVPIEWLFYAV